VTVQGATIVRAQTYAFDSPNDGILEQGPTRIGLRSRTTGDIDGLDVWLDQAQRGRLRFASETGTLEVDLATLGPGAPARFDFGGLDLHAVVTRYPETIETTALTLRADVPIPAGTTTPLLVKAIQTDGHMAWSSPVYVS
jgi:hypothetical protein